MLQLQNNRFLSEFSTFGIGGPIRSFVEVSTIEEMEEALSLNLPYFIVGKGSNCLFDDRGFDGLVILNKIDFCHWQEQGARSASRAIYSGGCVSTASLPEGVLQSEVTVGSGYPFSLLGIQTARKGFSGLEFASGIPASVGGAVFMNAGANGRETCDSLKSVLYFDGVQRTFTREELTFGYRVSPFQQMKGAILSATFSLTTLPSARKTQLQIVEARMKTQPLKDKSAGCVFRNPPGLSAGALIDRCGLKGTCQGGAKVSEIHANFIVNKGSATSRDVLELIRLVQEKVFEQTGIQLEPEIRLVHEP